MSAALWLLTALLCCALCGGVALAEEPLARAAPQATAATALPAVAQPSADPRPAVTLIDLNRASVDELTSLPGIGQKRAEAILAFRESHGGFQNVAQLLKIKGIGRAMLRKLRDLVTISSPGGNAADGQLAQAKGGSGELHRVR